MKKVVLKIGLLQLLLVACSPIDQAMESRISEILSRPAAPLPPAPERASADWQPITVPERDPFQP